MAVVKQGHKAFNIDFSAPSPTDANGEVHARKKRTETAPGMMADVLMAESSAIKENRELKTRLEDFDDAMPTRKIDPTSIVRSKWANRHEKSFLDKKFRQLKSEIESAGGNVQAIKVRPVRPLAGQDAKYEVVFGHRRHQACLELGFNVLALVEDVSDAELFAEMDRENRQRADLRPYEQGVMYAKALDEGLFPSMRKMGESLGVDVGGISKLVALAKLPAKVLQAFESPLDIHFQWGAPIGIALQKNPDLVLNRAHEIATRSPRVNAAQVFRELIAEDGVDSVNARESKPIIVTGKGGAKGKIAFNVKRGSFEISLKGLDKKRIPDIERAIKALLE